MKKFSHIIAAALIGLFAILLLIILSTPAPERPSYQSIQIRPTITANVGMQYEFLSFASARN